MAMNISDLIAPLRREIDPSEFREDSFSCDGKQYQFFLNNRPVLPGTDSVSVNHYSFTSGVDQTIPSGITGLANGFHYSINMNRAQVTILSGTFPNGVANFLWDGATLNVQYQSSTFTDAVLAGYLVDAVPSVESQLNLGFQVVDVAPSGAGTEDTIGYYSIGVSPNTVGVTPEPLQLVQTLIVKEAALKINMRERRLNSRNAGGISIRDGDIEINSSNTFRSLESAIKDTREELKQMYSDIKLNMDAGIGIKQINDAWMGGGGYPRAMRDDPDENAWRQYLNSPNNPSAPPF